MFRNAPLLSLICCSLFLSSVSFAATFSPHTYQLPHDTRAAKIDGVMDEPVWKHARVIELKYENDPGEGTPAPVKTKAYLYEDGKYLYIAFHAYDPDPKKIRASLRKRDDIVADDNVGLIIDTFDDQRNAYGFFVNAIGAQSDMTIVDHNGIEDDDSWDAIWDSAGKITKDGYIVEMAIPFSALRFPNVKGPLDWGIELYRNYPRKTWQQMSNLPEDRNQKCSLCQFETLRGFDKVKPGKNIQLTPTMTVSRSDYKGPPAAPVNWQQGDWEKDVGLNLRWGVTENAVVNATLNPDFSQVEADSIKLDVNKAFSIYYPEKRPFFMDGADYFTTKVFNFVHSRNIADPDYGVKLTGKADGHSYGVMLANDNKTAFLLPGSESNDIAQLDISSKVAIGRYKMDIGHHDTIGALVTSRTGNGYSNQLASVDGSYWIGDNTAVNYQVARAESTNPLTLQQNYGLAARQSGNAMSIGFDHLTRNNHLYGTYQRIGSGFRADLGFLSQNNVSSAEFGGGHTWYRDKQWIHKAQLTGKWNRSEDLDGQLLEQQWESMLILDGKMQYYGEFELLHRQHYYQGQTFIENQASAWNEITPVSGLLLAAYVSGGTEVDLDNARLADKQNLETYFQWQINQHVQVFIYHAYTALSNHGDTVLNANLTDSRLTWQFDMRNRLSLVVQYTDIHRDLTQYVQPQYYSAKEKQLTTQLLYSYEINPQTLVFLGYSDNGHQDDYSTGLTKTDRTVFAKFSYAFQM